MEENIEEYNRIPGAIRISKDRTVNIEDLIMKVAMVEAMLALQGEVDSFSDAVGELPEPIGQWANLGMRTSLGEVQHALKCGLYGYENAYHN